MIFKKKKKFFYGLYFDSFNNGLKSRLLFIIEYDICNINFVDFFVKRLLFL